MHGAMSENCRHIKNKGDSEGYLLNRLSFCLLCMYTAIVGLSYPNRKIQGIFCAAPGSQAAGKFFPNQPLGLRFFRIVAAISKVNQ